MAEDKDNQEILELIKTEVDVLHNLLGLGESITEEVSFGQSNEERCVINVEYVGDDLGFLIGSEGRHLRSIQWILVLMVKGQVDGGFQEDGKRITVVVDAGGYLDDRRKKVEQIALSKADDARITGKPTALPPMNAYERRVVHMLVSRFSDIQSESIGQGRDRYVRIIPVDIENVVDTSVGEEVAESEE